MPSFPSVILKSDNLDLAVSPSLSDTGLCATLNGNSIEDTFLGSNNKIKNFQNIFGKSAESPFKPTQISGSGNIHQKKMWLNVRDVSGPEETKGMMKVAINDWKDFVSVR